MRWTLYIPPGTMANASGSRRCCRSWPCSLAPCAATQVLLRLLPLGLRQRGGLCRELNPEAALDSGWGAEAGAAGGSGPCASRHCSLSPESTGFALFLLCCMGTLLSPHAAPVGGHDLAKIIMELQFSLKGLLREYVSVLEPCALSRFFPMLSIVPRRRDTPGRDRNS